MSVSVQELGDQVRAARNDQQLSQDNLAERLGPAVNRSNIAHLEQGIRVPSKDVLEAICGYLGVSTKYWYPFKDPAYRSRLEFEEALSELVGEPVNLRFVDEHADEVAGLAVSSLFSETRNQSQARDALNSLLVFYGVPPMTAEFFDRYLGVEATKSPEKFMVGSRKFQKEAIRLFSTFGDAYRAMNRKGELKRHLQPLQPRDVSQYHNREPWIQIEEVVEERLPDLGYISAKKARKERLDREALADFLRQLADDVAKDGKQAIETRTPKRRRKMRVTAPKVRVQS